MSSINKLILFSYPNALDTKQIQRLFGENTTILIETSSRTVIIQYNSKEEAETYYSQHVHNFHSIHYCTEEHLRHFLDGTYTLKETTVQTLRTKLLSKHVAVFRPVSST